MTASAWQEPQQGTAGFPPCDGRLYVTVVSGRGLLPSGARPISSCPACPHRAAAGGTGGRLKWGLHWGAASDGSSDSRVELTLGKGERRATHVKFPRAWVLRGSWRGAAELGLPAAL